MNKVPQILTKPIENKTITWFKNSNEYLVLENTTALILEKFNQGIATKVIADSLSKKLSIPLEDTLSFVKDLKNTLYTSKTKTKPLETTNYHTIEKPKKVAFIKYYKINDRVFKIGFSDELEFSYIHPKFAHLEVAKTTFHHEFLSFICNQLIFLYVNNRFIGAWKHDEIEFFQGKFSMQLIQKIHQKEENEWMGVFHASAVSNGKKSALFLGDSGNGKSTSLALLQANGFTCLADDFVPIDIQKQEIYSFPAAISVKKNSLEALLPIYPELKTSAEYHFKRLNKTVRYLKPNTNTYSSRLPCKALVFIKYEKNAALSCTKISKIEAFEQLIPDSWISPEIKNAEIFLDWFSKLICYQLTYSNNEKMIETVTEIFKNDL